MHVIVFSDSHDNFPVLRQIVEDNPEAAAYLHLGDGIRDMEDLQSLYPDRRILGVRGNCDWSSRTDTDGVLSAGGVRIFYTHGHMYNVKYSLDRLREQAKVLRAKVACFGHTHMPLCLHEDGLYLLNPGSVSYPRRGRGSYGVIDITDSKVALDKVYL